MEREQQKKNGNQILEILNPNIILITFILLLLLEVFSSFYLLGIKGDMKRLIQRKHFWITEA